MRKVRAMLTIKTGAKGPEVKDLQTALNRAGANLSVDGAYGPKTEQAVRNFQEDRGLTVDGICGSATWKALERFMVDYSEVREAVEKCVEAVEKLPEYKRLEALLYG